MDKKIIIAVVVSACVFGGGGYMIGKKSAPQVPQGLERGGFGDRMGGQNGAGRMGGRQGGFGGATMGEVLSKDGSIMTVKLRDGGSKIVFYSTSTAVTRSATGTLEDMKVGGQVFVTGAQNADGSVTAESIQLRPDVQIGR